MADIEDLIMRDTRANQPAAGIPGRLYEVVDEDIVERDNGSTWELFAVVVSGGAGSDTTALHTTADGEINALTEKTTPVGDDVIVIEDSADGFSKKYIKISSLPSSGGGVNPLLPVTETLDLQDLFADADGTNLTGHTMDQGSGWSAVAGSITVQGNAAQCQSGTNDYQATGTYHHCKIVVDIKCGEATANCAPGIIFRGTTTTRYLLAYFSGDGNGVLYFRNGGSFTQLATFIWPADTNWHTITITALGSTITIQVDSGMVWTFANIKQQGAGLKYGIRGFINGANKDMFDNFNVYGDPTEEDFPGTLFPTNVLTDNFTQADTTRLNTFGWTEDVGTWQVDTNKAKQTLTSSPTNGYVVEQDFGIYDLAVEVTITTPASGGSICGIVLRSQDKNNYIEVELNTSNAPTKGFALWYTNDSGVFTEIASADFTPATNTTYTFRIWAKGNVIKAYLVEANLIILGYCDMFLEATKAGLFEARDGTRINPNLYDDYKVYSA